MTLWLRIRAPFAAFRWMQAGVYRATSPVIAPSAAWGLVLNLAGIETRVVDDASTTTQIREDAPALRLAIGVVTPSEVATLYQQLHSYPVGSSGGALKERSYGSKYWIAPARREVLVGLDVLLGVESTVLDVVELVQRGLRGVGGDRYGLPFAGDNNFLIDRIDVLTTPEPAFWYAGIDPDSRPRPGSCRLTVGIDRRDSASTTSRLFAPVESATERPPEGAWTWVPREPRDG